MPFVIENTETIFLLFGPLAISIIGAVIVTVIAYYYGSKLSSYTKKKMPKIWKKVYSPDKPKEILNPFRVSNYLSSDLGNDDKNILELKKTLRRRMRYQKLMFLIVFISIVYTIFALYIASKTFGV